MCTGETHTKTSTAAIHTPEYTHIQCLQREGRGGVKGGSSLEKHTGVVGGKTLWSEHYLVTFEHTGILCMQENSLRAHTRTHALLWGENKSALSCSGAVRANRAKVVVGRRSLGIWTHGEGVSRHGITRVQWRQRGRRRSRRYIGCMDTSSVGGG